VAKSVIVSLNNQTSSFSISKIDRSKLYPTRKRIAIDENGLPCTRASIALDGSQVIKSGMTAQGYFSDEGRWVPKDEVVGINPDGSLAELYPSTLGIEQKLEGPVNPSDILSFEVSSVYHLGNEGVDDQLQTELTNGNIFRFPFNYGADFNLETAYLLSNSEGTFCLVGNPKLANWIEEAAVFVPDSLVVSDDDDLDFEMV